MSIPEAAIEETPAGRCARRGWFVLSLIGARGFATDGHGAFCPFERPARARRLRPRRARAAARRAVGALPPRGRAGGLLVLAGECIAVVEEQERTLRAWDYLHCPAGTAHAMLGAGGAGARSYGRRASARRTSTTRSARRPPATASRRRCRATTRARRPVAPAGPRERAGADALAGLTGEPGSWRARREGRRAGRSAGARSPRGSTSTRSSPSQPAIDAELRASSAAVSGGASGSACAACTRSAPACAVGLEVDPRDEPVAEQERQHVVAVHALGRRHVDLDPVAEAEQPLDARALPDQRVERPDQRPRRRRAAARRAAGSRYAGPRQPSTSTGSSSPASTSSATRARASATAQPEVVAQVALGRHAERARGDAHAARAGPRPPAASAPRAPRRAARARAGRRGARTRAAART